MAMKQAMPGPGQFDALNDFLQGMECIFERNKMPEGDEDYFEMSAEDAFSWIRDKWEFVGPVWQRVLFAGLTAIQNACDPNEKTLEWKPSIKRMAELLAIIRKHQGNCCACPSDFCHQHVQKKPCPYAEIDQVLKDFEATP